MAKSKRKGKRKTTAQIAASKRNLEKARLAAKKGVTKKKVPGMRGKAKVPSGMRTNRNTGTRLYGSNIYSP